MSSVLAVDSSQRQEVPDPREIHAGCMGVYIRCRGSRSQQVSGRPKRIMESPSVQGNMSKRNCRWQVLLSTDDGPSHGRCEDIHNRRDYQKPVIH